MAHCFGSQGHETRIFIENVAWQPVHVFHPQICTWASTENVNGMLQSLYVNTSLPAFVVQSQFVKLIIAT